MASESFGIESAAYGTDKGAVEAFIDDIQIDCIDSLVSKLKETDDLFTKLRENWAGQSEKNFENNFNNTIQKLILQIKRAGVDLKTEITDVSVSMRNMDDNLIS